MLPSAHSCYFARFFYGADQELLVSHQTYSHAGRTYVSPFKRADVDDEGTLRFAWWEGNERLKGAEVTVAADPHAPCYFQTATNVSVGAVLEATVTLPPADAASWLEWPGFVIELRGGSALLIAVGPAGRVSLATAPNVSAPACFANATAVQWHRPRIEPATFTSSQKVPAPCRLSWSHGRRRGVFDRQLPGMAPGVAVSLRVLYRRDMLEVYLNDFLFPVYLMPPSRGRVGLIPATAPERPSNHLPFCGTLRVASSGLSRAGVPRLARAPLGDVSPRQRLMGAWRFRRSAGSRAPVGVGASAPGA